MIIEDFCSSVHGASAIMVMQAKTKDNVDAMLIEKDRELHTNRPLLFVVV